MFYIEGVNDVFHGRSKIRCELRPWKLLHMTLDEGNAFQKQIKWSANVKEPGRNTNLRL